MAHSRIGPAGRSMRQWLAIATVALAVGAALGVLLSQAPLAMTDAGPGTAPGRDAIASAHIAAVSGCCTAPVAWESPRAPAPPALAAGPSPADVYREARHYADCLALQEPERQALADVADERYAVDPTGGFAAALSRAEQEQRAACRTVGPHEYRQIEALMREAAARGDTDARFFFLEQRVFEAIAAAAAVGERRQSNATDAATVAEVETMALAGYRPAMALTAQLLTSGQLAAADPQRSAAWKLVAMQLEYPQPMTQDQLRGTGLFDELNPEEEQALRRQAAALLDRCCGFQAIDAAVRP